MQVNRSDTLLQHLQILDQREKWARWVMRSRGAATLPVYVGG